MLNPRRRVGRQAVLAVLPLLCLLLGCPKAPDYPKASSTADGEAVADNRETTETKDGTAPQMQSPPEAPQSLLEPFDPPPLAELDAKAEWEDQRVINIMDEFRKLKQTQPPLESVAAALKMKNNSTEDNAKILSALGQPWESEQQVNFDAELNRHIKGDINTTNAILQQSRSDFNVNGLTGLSFFGFDWNLKPFAPVEYVTSWQTSKDQLYDKVVMRDDLVWSDGVPVSAHDVKFSFQTIMNPGVEIPAVRSGMDKVRWVEAYDDHTFVIFHKESLATNVWNCNFPIVPKHIYEESMKSDVSMTKSDRHQQLEDDPICAGPYKVVKRLRGQEIVLERRENWYMHNGRQVRPKPHFKTIRFRVITDTNTSQLALVDGRLDELELEPMQWVEQTNDDAFYERNTKVRGTEWAFYYFGWNIETPYFNDVRVRKAMSYAVNYDQILKTLCYGLYAQCTGEFHPDSWAGPVKPRIPYHQDLAKADALLTEAGWVDSDGDGIRDKTIDGRKVKFEFSVMCVNEQLRVDICTSLSDSLNQLGIVCHVQPTEFTVMQQRAQDHKFQAEFAGWGVGADPSTSENLWKTEEQRNYTGYSNPRVDELFELAKKSLDRNERAIFYREIDDILWEDQPYTWLYYRSGFYAFNKHLRGYMFSPRGPFNYGPGFDSIWAAAE